MLTYKIRVEWISNDFVTVERVYNYTGKSYEFVQNELDLISKQLLDLMTDGKIKTYLVAIEKWGE